MIYGDVAVVAVNSRFDGHKMLIVIKADKWTIELVKTVLILN